MSAPSTSRPLTSRQETFARQFCATGNAAEAARRAGYAAGSARQTGHDLLNRPWVIERIRAIREHWRQTAQSEAAILLARLEQAWDVAVASQSAGQMLQVIRLQAEIAGLSRKGAAARADLWDAPGEVLEEGAERISPLASAVRQGRERAERARADLRRQVRVRQRDPAFDGTAHVARQRQLDRAIDERRTLLRRTPCTGTPATASADDSLTDHDSSLQADIGDDWMSVDAAEAGQLAMQVSQAQAQEPCQRENPRHPGRPQGAPGRRWDRN